MHSCTHFEFAADLPSLPPQRFSGLGAFSAVAVALTTSAGGPQLRMENRAQTAAIVGGPGAWTTLPGSVVPGLDVPAGEPTRLINARFTAESNCYGPNQGYCMVRIIAVDANNVMTPLEPASDTDFHFDSDEPGATVASY